MLYTWFHKNEPRAFMRHAKVLGSFVIAMISVSAILNLRGLPMMASLGWQAIFFYTLAFVTFLIPSALICAELATHYPKNGGVYTWSKRAFGDRAGILVIWMEWSNNIIAFPATLSTIVLTLSYVGFPELMQNKALVFITILGILWAAVFYNLLGVKASSRLNVLGALFGTILPGALIIILGVIGILKHGFPHLQDNSFLPGFNIHHLAIFVGVLSAYAGMQVTAFYAENAKNPAKSYPLGLLSAALIIFVLTILGVLAIFSVINPSQINLINGVIQAFSAFFTEFHMPWFVPVLALLIAFGGISSLSAWLVGPARGLREMLYEHQMYPVLSKLNKGDMPAYLLITEGIIATLLASCFLWMPNLQSAFWLLIALTSQFTVLMYIFLFASAIKLRLSRNETHVNAFTIPGGNVLLCLIAGIAILASLIAFIFGLFPLDNTMTNTFHYVVLMIVGDIVILLLPFLLFKKLRR